MNIIKTYPINLSNYDTIILIDDVTTTGSTFVECTQTIKNQFAFLKIIGIAVAGN